MKKFLLNTLSSFIGTWIAITIFSLVALCAVIGIGAMFMTDSQTDNETIGKHSVLVIDLKGHIAESERDPYFNYMSMKIVDKPLVLKSIVNAIRGAEKNVDVKAIYLKCNSVSADPATLNSLHQELLNFRHSGKKIIAYGDNYTTSDYYLASAADSIVMNPGGTVDICGLGGTSLYLKDLYDKIGISYQVVKVGTFKSAVEPYICNEMSEPAREQLDTLFNYMWDTILEDIHASRHEVSAQALNTMVDSYLFTLPPKEILQNKLIDKLEYERNMEEMIARMIGVEKKEMNFIKIPVIANSCKDGEGYDSTDRIAVVYASGDINDNGGKDAVDYKWMVPLITELAEDEKVKGMVLRVNSPGGSVFGSEQIGEALDYFQSKGKPLAVSMGGYAASGGYWISCCADRIFANPLTITGSIGIFGLFPNFAGLEKKLGVHPQTVATNPEAMFPTEYSPMNERQLSALQRKIENGYNSFVSRVAKGRHLSEAKVRNIGDGRVWDAKKAIELGLVDEFGNLEDAVKWVAEKADISDKYATADYPIKEPSVWDFIPSDISKMIDASAGVGIDMATMKIATKLLCKYPIQARMSYFGVSLGKSYISSVTSDFELTIDSPCNLDK